MFGSKARAAVQERAFKAGKPVKAKVAARHAATARDAKATRAAGRARAKAFRQAAERSGGMPPI